MSTGKLYQEAINEANDLVKMAEERARDKLIESVMPRIRSLLEKRILEGEGEEEEVNDDDLDMILSQDSDGELEDGDASMEATSDDVDHLEDDAEDFEEVGTSALPPVATPAPVDSADGLDIKVPRGVKKVTLTVAESKKGTKTSSKLDKIVNLDESNVQDLIRLVDGRGTLVERARSLQLELKMIRRGLDTLNGREKLRAGGRIVEEFNAVLRKAIGLKQEIKDSVPGPLAESAKRELTKIEKEIVEMSTKTLLRNLLSEGRRGINENLFEDDDVEMDAGDDDSGDDTEMDADDSAGEEMSAEDALAQIKDILAQVGGDEAGEDMGEEPLEDAGEEDESADEGMTYEVDMADEGEMYEGEEEEEGMDEGQVFEIDESMLRRELGRLRALREAANGATAMAHHFGGGKAGKDAFESPAKLNKHEGGAAKKAGRGKSESKAEEVDESDESDKKESVKESRRNRALKSSLSEAAKAIKALGRQLNEQKLFNAKLLYVNKLMQSSSLTDKQFRSIVEALDSAKNLREAHLLYSSLSESLAKHGRSLSEGVRSAGGSSRPVGKASAGTTLNEGVVVDRWATLAGIK